VRFQYEISDSLLESGFTDVQLQNNGELIHISPKTMKRILPLTFKEQQVKLRKSKRVPNKSYFESFEDRKARLKRLYGLKLLEVVPKNGESGTTEVGILKLAEKAAATFVETISCQPGVPTVGIGGGQTLRLMSIYLELAEVRPFVSAPLNFVMRVPEEKIFDSDALAKSIYRTAGRGSSPGFGILPTPTNDPLAAATWHRMLFDANPEIRKAFHACINPDVVFVGAGNFYENSQTITKLTKHMGMDYEFLNSMNPRPVGDINFCFFDKDGRDISSAVLEKFTAQHGEPVSTFFPEEPWCHPFFVGVNIARMKKMVEEDKPVVVVAGCDEGAKAHCLRALLKAEVMNGLVTDSTTMDALLRFEEQPAA
jgi:DNA-binding transcriptional regulator LsrR (DeoR family)